MLASCSRWPTLTASVSAHAIELPMLPDQDTQHAGPLGLPVVRIAPVPSEDGLSLPAPGGSIGKGQDRAEIIDEGATGSSLGFDEDARNRVGLQAERMGCRRRGALVACKRQGSREAVPSGGELVNKGREASRWKGVGSTVAIEGRAVMLFCSGVGNRLRESEK